MNTTMTDRQTVRVNPNNPIEVDDVDQTQRDSVASRRAVNFSQACEQREFDEQSIDTHIAPLINPNVTQRVNFNPKEKPQRVNQREEAKQVEKKGGKKRKKEKRKRIQRLPKKLFVSLVLEVVLLMMMVIVRIATLSRMILLA